MPVVSSRDESRLPKGPRKKPNRQNPWTITHSQDLFRATSRTRPTNPSGTSKTLECCGILAVHNARVKSPRRSQSQTGSPPSMHPEKSLSPSGSPAFHRPRSVLLLNKILAWNRESPRSPQESVLLSFCFTIFFMAKKRGHSPLAANSGGQSSC